jgi:thymidine kinase
MTEHNVFSTTSNDNGYLEIILGPMFSGKTTSLMEIYKQCTYCNIPVAIINHCIDNRYDTSLLSSHDKVMIPCMQCKSLRDLWDEKPVDTSFDENGCNHIKLRSSKILLINEGQFFDDLYETVLEMLQEKKQIYICGLDGDFNKNKFGQLLDLIPHCDKVTKLTSLCSKCRDGTRGIFSLRLTHEKEQTLVGSDNYIPVCRKCYNTSRV